MRVLDENGYPGPACPPTAAKYASVSLYGPFRDAVESQLRATARPTSRTCNALESLPEVRLDVAEGADLVMVKPALALPRHHHPRRRRGGHPGSRLPGLRRVRHGRGRRRQRLAPSATGAIQNPTSIRRRRRERDPDLLGPRRHPAAGLRLRASRRARDRQASSTPGSLKRLDLRLRAVVGGGVSAHAHHGGRGLGDRHVTSAGAAARSAAGPGAPATAQHAPRSGGGATRAHVRRGDNTARYVAAFRGHPAPTSWDRRVVGRAAMSTAFCEGVRLRLVIQSKTQGVRPCRDL